MFFLVIDGRAEATGLMDDGSRFPIVLNIQWKNSLIVSSHQIGDGYRYTIISKKVLKSISRLEHYILSS